MLFQLGKSERRVWHQLVSKAKHNISKLIFHPKQLSRFLKRFFFPLLVVQLLVHDRGQSIDKKAYFSILIKFLVFFFLLWKRFNLFAMRSIWDIFTILVVNSKKKNSSHWPIDINREKIMDIENFSVCNVKQEEETFRKLMIFSTYPCWRWRSQASFLLVTFFFCFLCLF